MKTLNLENYLLNELNPIELLYTENIDKNLEIVINSKIFWMYLPEMSLLPTKLLVKGVCI